MVRPSADGSATRVAADEAARIGQVGELGEGVEQLAGEKEVKVVWSGRWASRRFAVTSDQPGVARDSGGE